RTVFGASCSYSPLPARMIVVSRFRVSHINNVVLVYEDSAGPPKLLPLGNKFSVLIENLNAIVGAVADENPALGIHGNSMGGIKLTRSTSFFAPRLDELSIFGEFHDAGIAVSAVSIGHKDVSIGGDNHIGRLIECVRTI